MAVERMTFSEFEEHCGVGIIHGYALEDGQIAPSTYAELVVFLATKLKVEPPTRKGLEAWIAEGAPKRGESCSPLIDERHTRTILLIGELTSPDRYVERLPVLPAGPDDSHALVFPPIETVEGLLALERLGRT